jgi:hypothetical protein
MVVGFCSAVLYTLPCQFWALYVLFRHVCVSKEFISSSKCRLFHNATFFGSCIIHILYTGCAKIEKKIPAPKG